MVLRIFQMGLDLREQKSDQTNLAEQQLMVDRMD